MSARLRTGRSHRTYLRREPERTVLHRVVAEALPALRAELERRDDRALPGFVEREMDRFLRCGVLSEGFARFRCSSCGAERLVALMGSRAWRPARRAAELT